MSAPDWNKIATSNQTQNLAVQEILKVACAAGARLLDEENLGKLVFTASDAKGPIMLTIHRLLDNNKQTVKT